MIVFCEFEKQAIPGVRIKLDNKKIGTGPDTQQQP